MNDAQLASDSLSTDQSNHAAGGSCADNAAAESFFGILKRERVNRRQYQTRVEARADIFDYIERWHNPGNGGDWRSGAGRETLNSSVPWKRGRTRSGLGGSHMIFDGQSFETWSVPGYLRKMLWQSQDTRHDLSSIGLLSAKR